MAKQIIRKQSDKLFPQTTVKDVFMDDTLEVPLNNYLADVGIFVIKQEDIVTSRVNLATSWIEGYGINTEQLIVEQNSNYNITDYIPITEGGIFSIEYIQSRIPGAVILCFDGNYNGVYAYKDETETMADGRVLTTFSTTNDYVILKNEYVKTYSIAYMKIAVPSSYNYTNIGIYKFSRASIVDEKRDSFEAASNGGKVIRMSWFNRQSMNDSAILNYMYSLASIGATLYLDAGDITLTTMFDTAADGLGKSISIIGQNTKIYVTDDYSSSYIINYIQSYMTKNISIYDEQGDVFEIKPIISGIIFECNDKCGGMCSKWSRGLLLENLFVHNASTYGIRLDTSSRSGYEYLVNKCRFVYDLYKTRDNVAIGGNAGDSEVINVIVIGYNRAIYLPNALLFQNIHGWIGFNYEYQLNNSIFLEANNAMVIGCYADTYEKGFVASGGTVTCCRIHSNSAFSLNPPVNEISQNVKVFGNNF